MGFQLVAFPKLCDSVRESVTTLLKDHGCDPAKQDESIQQLPEQRRIHAQLLLKIVGLLEASNLPADKIDKVRILNAAVYFVRDQIDESYKNVPTVFIGLKNPVRSSFFNSLSTSLGLNKENLPVKDDLVELYSHFSKFLYSHVYVSGDPRKGYLAIQPFSNENIKGYSVEKDIKSLADKKHQMNGEIRDAAEAAHLKQLAEAKKAGAKSKGVLGLFGGSSAPAPAAAASSSIEPKQ